MTNPSLSGALIIALLSATPDPSQITPLLHSALTSHPISSIHILGLSSPALQALKLESYALAGKAGRNVAIATGMLASPLDLVALETHIATLAQRGVRGVILALPPVEGKGLLTLDAAGLQNLVDASLGAVRAVARPVVEALCAAAEEGGATFFALAGEGAGFARVLSGLALDEVRRTVGPGVEVGRAGDVLPLPTPDPSGGGGLGIEVPTVRVVDTDEESVDAGSPTKLWASWALREEGKEW